MLTILSGLNPILSQKAKTVSKINKSILDLIQEMKQTLLAAQDPIGVGLAAPQVGIPLQIFLAKPTLKSPIQVFINPKIEVRGDTTGRVPAARTRYSEGMHQTGQYHSIRPSPEPYGSGTVRPEGIPSGAPTGGKGGAGPRAKDANSSKLEGCLSLPNIWGEVERKPESLISYLDERGKTHTRKVKGLISTIIQHEIDHLNGILFPKKVLEQKGILYKSQKNEKGEDVFEEIQI